MSRAAPILAAVLIALTASGAHAADPAQLDCPLAGLSEDQRRALDDYIAEQGSSEDPQFRAYDGAVEQCATRFHWSARAREGAFGFGFATAVERHMRRLLTARGVDLAPLEAAVLADRALIAAEMGSEAQQQALYAFLRRHADLVAQAAAAHASDERVQAWIGAFIATRAIRDSARAIFLAN